MVLDPAILPQLRKKAMTARKSRHLTQKELGERIGASQGQISDFETGNRPTLGEGKIRELCDELRVQIPDASGATRRQPRSVLAFCPDPWCPGAIIRTIPRHVLIKPTFVKTVSEAACNCEICGEVLVQQCQQCRRPVEVAVCCPKCGQDYVDAPDVWQGLDADQLREIDVGNRRFLAELSKDEAQFR